MMSKDIQNQIRGGKTMYYNECIKSYAVEIIREIAEECAEPYKAMELIEKFVNNEITTDEVTNAIYE